jgi:cation diffusion facilitator CzcD-associated flavoprotein CzcO
VNSENKVTAYQDFPFPSDAPLYPDHKQMVDYFEAYADRFQLRKHIRFHSKVNRVRRDDASGGAWWVQVNDLPEEKFDAVVVATGHQGVPSHPPFAKDFSGQYQHSHTYRVPEPFRDKNVLVIGIGNSACDIASDICTVTASTTIAARSPVLLMPRMFLGVPTSRVLGKLEKPWMPWPIRRWFRILVSRMAHGTMEQWGFRTPQTRTHPAGHHLLMGHFIWSRIKAKPGISRVNGNDVTFDDGTHQKFDCMIAATGYSVDLPFLDATTSPAQGHWLNLYHRVVHPTQKNLFFVGFFNVSGGGNVRMMDDQSHWIAQLMKGAMKLPSQAQMQKEIERERDDIKKLYPDTPRYTLELDPVAYRARLQKAMSKQ